jgi:uncharacterized repeat protein (TIGR03806 family)
MLGALLLLLGACSDRSRDVTVPAPDAYPAQLSAWHLLERDGDALVLHEAALPYDLATPLFSDYAAKLRTVWMPAGTAATFDEADVFEFPVGTVLSKTFYYPAGVGADGVTPVVFGRDTDPGIFDGRRLDLTSARLLETRLLVKQRHGWDALVYVWDTAQREATLQPTGDIVPMTISVDEAERTFHYIVPNHNECAACHAVDQNARHIQPIGPAARHLDKVYAHYADGPAPQLDRWRERGYLAGGDGTEIAALPIWDAAATDDTAHRARAYLDINCGHCHQPSGSGDTSGLFLHITERSPRRLGVCKPPIAAGTGTGGRRFSIVPGAPDASILMFRSESEHPAIRMPEIGRTLVHDAGVALLSRWIAEMPGTCDPINVQ